MSEHDHQGAADELAAVVLTGVGWTVALARAAIRALVITLIVLVVIGAPFFLWGVLVGW